MTPIIGLVCLAVILASWFGGVRFFKGAPGGLVAIAVGAGIAWIATLMGYPMGGIGPEQVQGALATFGLHLPSPAIPELIGGFKYIGIILVTAIPFGIYDLVEAMDNVRARPPPATVSPPPRSSPPTASSA